MRAYVLSDARLAKRAGQVVRLDIDTEKPSNAWFVETFPIDAWPTLLAIDPATERVILRWAGTATVAQVERLLADAVRAMRVERDSKADQALARADRLLGERRHAEAAAAYREALTTGGKGWARRERAAEALVQASGFAGNAGACVDAARAVLSSLAPGAAEARVAAQGLACALDVEDEVARLAALDLLEPLARKARDGPGVLADDRSWLYDELVQARLARGDESGAKAGARRWLSFLEREAARAPTSLARSAFDGQRLSAAIQAGDPARALPALLASERDLPDDFVPPTNLGVLYLELDEPGEALAAADRALSRAEGPRRIRVMVLRAQAQEALGDRAGARATLARALSESTAMPEAVRPKTYTARAKALLDRFGKAE